MFMLYDEKTGEKNFYDTKEEVIETLEAFEECGFERNDFTVYVAYTPDEFDCYFQRGDSCGSLFLFGVVCLPAPGRGAELLYHAPDKKVNSFFENFTKKIIPEM